jgi:hypothetical protein
MLGCVVFKNICFFLVYVTMCTRSWLWFTLIACWLAMSEKALLKSIILKIPKSVSYQLLEYPIFKIWKIFSFKAIEVEGLHYHQSKSMSKIGNRTNLFFKPSLFQEISYLYLRAII